MHKLEITPWTVTGKSLEDRAFRESIFSVGNGYMGTRGYRPDEKGENSAWRSTFMSGFFEYIQPGITDMVNQPDFSALNIELNGVDSGKLLVTSFNQTLFMRSGLLEWRFVLTDSDGRRTDVLLRKFLSMDNRHLAAVSLNLTPVNWSGSVSVSGGIDGSVENLPIADDQLVDNVEFARMWGSWEKKERPGGGVLTVRTSWSGRKTVEGYRLTGEGSRNTHIEEKTICTTLESELRKGTPWTVYKVAAVASFRDGDPEEIVEKILEDTKNESFDELFAKSAKAWEAIWDDCDVILHGNDELQGAVRYNIFQLICATPHNDSHASIGARGLTHGRYKGCYFWDTEIFMLPFLMWTRPEEAKNLLMYRYNTLPDAIESAKKFSTVGARYSWMASDTGFEQCGSWDTGCCEIHITADIAFAIGRYCHITGDIDFLRDCGTEMFIQTARYWVDRFNYSRAEDRWHLLFVKGPDEYCGVTTDDFYTVSMAKVNLEYAISSVRWMKNNCPEKWAELSKRISFDEQEMYTWRNIIDKSVLVFDEEKGVWKQDATFDYLEPLDIAAHKKDDIPLYHKIGFDRLQRYMVLKQPAVLMYMAIRPECFNRKEVEAAWNYYEPKTLHDSTLSFGIHALMAARLGKSQEAARYFNKSAYLDLRDVMQNTGKEGIHSASLGATLQAIILGFGGLDLTGKEPQAAVQLPEGIEGIEYTVKFRKKKYRIKILKDAEKPVILKTKPFE